MTRYIRNTAILAKLETAYNTDAAPAGTDALLVSNVSINPFNANNVDRDLIRPYFGASEQLLGTFNLDMSFDVEIAGSGSAGTAPRWGKLLRACGYAEVLTASTRADYTPISTGQESVTLYWYDDGVLHKGFGCRGEVGMNMKVGNRPVFSFKLLGLGAAISAVALPTVDFTGWQTPLVMSDVNSGDLTLGGTVAPTGAPAIVGGAAFPSTGLELTGGNSTNYTALLGGESVDITARAVTGKIELDLTAAQEVSYAQIVRLATLSSMSLAHGTQAGNKVLVHMPSVQLINQSKAELNGRRLIGYDLRAVPSPGGGGNDDLRIVAF